MQQVGSGSRFWWRALDARSPQPITTTPPVARFQRLLTVRPPRSDTQFTLAVPRGDRRRIKRKTKKHSAMTLLAAAVVALLGAASAISFTLSEMTLAEAQQSARDTATRLMIGVGFGIEQVNLTGQRYTLDSEVFDALDLANVRTFAALDTSAVLKRIERISWVDTAQISRVFPGILNIEITERAPAAIWHRGDKSVLIDATGRTLGPLPANSAWRLPHIAGEGASKEAPLLLAALAAHANIAARVSFAERIAERRWSVVLKTGSRIELGADREIEGLAHVASNAELRTALDGAPVTIDVRTPGRAIVRSSTATTAASAPRAVSRAAAAAEVSP